MRHSEARRDLIRVEHVVAVVPDERLTLAREDVAELDTRADVACFAIGVADVVPVGRKVLGVEKVEGGVVGELSGG